MQSVTNLVVLAPIDASYPHDPDGTYKMLRETYLRFWRERNAQIIDSEFIHNKHDKLSLVTGMKKRVKNYIVRGYEPQEANIGTFEFHCDVDMRLAFLIR